MEPHNTSVTDISALPNRVSSRLSVRHAHQPVQTATSSVVSEYHFFSAVKIITASGRTRGANVTANKRETTL